MNKRMKPKQRRAAILEATLPLATLHGYTGVTREQIAAASGIAGSVVHYHFKTMAQLRKKLLQYAVEVECLPVIAQGIALNDPVVNDLAPELRKRAKESLR